LIWAAADLPCVRHVAVDRIGNPGGAGASATTLGRWRAEALASASGEPANVSAHRWMPVAWPEAVIATAAMDEASRGARCREQGTNGRELEAWKQDAIAGLGAHRTGGRPAGAL
jgi:hypothetical protein